MIVTRRPLKVVLIYLFLLPFGTRCQEVIWKQSGELCAVAVRVLQASEFSAAPLTRRALSEVERFSGATFVHVTFVTRNESPTSAFIDDHSTYRTWYRSWTSARPTPLSVARLVRIGEDAVLEFANGGQLSQIQLAGRRNPLLIHSDGFNATIRYFNFRGSMPIDGGVGGTPGEVSVFATTEILSLSKAREIYWRLRDSLPTKILMLYLRSDPFFLEPGLPVRSPFLAWDHFPNMDDYSNSSTIACSFVPEVGPRCIQYQHR